MPPAKTHDARVDGSTTRERQLASAAHARSKKQTLQSTNVNMQNGSTLKDLPLYNPDTAAQQPQTGMAWNTAPLELLDTYRVAHNLQTPTAFTTPLRQALLTNSGIGRHSPTMARKKEKRRVSKEQLALAVRKNFNGAAVSEIDVVVDLVYKVRNQDKAFRMRSMPAVPKNAKTS
ncbi:unnamed protein product [Zymoseptoria tritici ST99CH_3D1]|uniref:Histone deacetylase complex subunit SAP30 Sin3 binding domain-containing protein n=2 Tax=Zymoseptoria tritici TaxID=1047171 RepID=A0A1X7RU58_ZYMT9|nr:unnamed protein product [Zymoseptoria tritici ST99CH_3D7]SMR52892.1 unnamed protein product [Zymoseptoria tritici ST99CH_1E4]SMR54311.1 unnamed protein product [Zymoseptoria tritici ST99CH_3D1]